MKNHYFFLGLSLLLFSCCETARPTTTENSMDMELSKNEGIIINENEPLIAFFNFRLWKEKEEIQIQKISTSVANGKLKKDYKKEAALKEDYILCSFLDSEEVVIKQTLVTNYLDPSPENLQQGQKEATFFLKTQWSENISTVRFELINENSTKKLLKVIEL